VIHPAWAQELDCDGEDQDNIDCLGRDTDPEDIIQSDSDTKNLQPYELDLWRSFILQSASLEGESQGLVFEAQIAPNLFLYQNLHARMNEGQLYTRRRRWVPAVSFSLSPMVRFRMIDSPSNPVRTPSFMPFFAGQFFALRRTRALPEAPISQIAKSPIEMLIATLFLQHHSNGQDGCFFAAQERVDGDCQFSPSSDPNDLTINRTDGSFTTNRIMVSLSYRRTYVDNNYMQTASWHIGPRIEINPKGLPLGGITDEIYDLYGPTRLRLFGGFDRHGKFLGIVGRQWIDGWGEYLFEPLEDDLSPLRIQAESGFTIRRLNDLGFFLRFYNGQDYYNLAFRDSLSLLQFGITFKTGPGQQFDVAPVLPSE